MAKNSLSITDNRTGASFEVPIVNGTVDAMAFRAMKANDQDFGLMTYDPGYKNTAACKSRVTFIDGDKGILRYRGYAIEELAENCTFLEVAYLLLRGELPTQDELDYFVNEVTHHTFH